MIIGIRLAGTVILWKVFIPIGAGVLKASNPNSLLELEGNVIMTEMWGRVVLKSMDWVKREGTTGKFELSQQLLAEENLYFRCLPQKLFMSMINHHKAWLASVILNITWKIHL